MKKTLCTWLALFSVSAHADVLPALSDDIKPSPHRLYFSSYDTNFDEWRIEGGYTYQLLQSVDIYVGARMNGHDRNQKSVLSGVSYQWSDRWVISSALRTYKYEDVPSEANQETNVAAEVSSRYKISESLDFHATLDYQEVEKEVAVGIGFRF